MNKKLPILRKSLLSIAIGISLGSTSAMAQAAEPEQSTPTEQAAKVTQEAATSNAPATSAQQDSLTNTSTASPEAAPAAKDASANPDTEMETETASNANVSNAPESQEAKSAPPKTSPEANTTASKTDVVDENAPGTAESSAETDSHNAEAVTSTTTADSPAETGAETAVADSVKKDESPAAASDGPSTQKEAVAENEGAKKDSTSKEAEVASTEKHILDILHGNAYNMVGNEAAAATVGGNLAMPHKMKGLKFGYFEPIDERGVVSFGDANTYFLAFDNSEDLGLVTAGFAAGRFGFSINAAVGYSLSKINVDTTETESSGFTKGSLFGATASARLGNFDLAIKGEYSFPQGDTHYEETYNKVDVNTWDALGKLSLSNSANSKFAWTFNVSFLRHEFETESKNTVLDFVKGENALVTTKTSVTDTSARIEITPEFNFGSTILKSEKARVFVGLNTAVPIVLYDEIENTRDKNNIYGVFMTPNILGEVYLGKYVSTFASAAYQWEVANFSTYELDKTEIKSFNLKSESTEVNLGARFQYGCAAVEMVFTKQFLGNPFGSFSDNDEIAASIGAFIMF